jgi:hypothetical protein
MIVITVDSEIVEATRVFKKDGPSIRWLKQIDRIHQTARKIAAGKKPLLKNYYKGKGRMIHYKEDVKSWERTLRSSVPLKIFITHEKAA